MEYLRRKIIYLAVIAQNKSCIFYWKNTVKNHFAVLSKQTTFLKRTRSKQANKSQVPNKCGRNTICISSTCCCWSSWVSSEGGVNTLSFTNDCIFKIKSWKIWIVVAVSCNTIAVEPSLTLSNRTIRGSRWAPCDLSSSLNSISKSLRHWNAWKGKWKFVRDIITISTHQLDSWCTLAENNIHVMKKLIATFFKLLYSLLQQKKKLAMTWPRAMEGGPWTLTALFGSWSRTRRSKSQFSWMKRNQMDLSITSRGALSSWLLRTCSTTSQRSHFFRSMWLKLSTKTLLIIKFILSQSPIKSHYGLKVTPISSFYLANAVIFRKAASIAASSSSSHCSSFMHLCTVWRSCSAKPSMS